jgi:hypothetical protein
MATEQVVTQRRAHLVRLVLDLGEDDAMKWLEEKVWIENVDEYGGANIENLVVEELDILSDEEIERCISELEA